MAANNSLYLSNAASAGPLAMSLVPTCRIKVVTVSGTSTSSRAKSAMVAPDWEMNAGVPLRPGSKWLKRCLHWESPTTTVVGMNLGYFLVTLSIAGASEAMVKSIKSDCMATDVLKGKKGRNKKRNKFNSTFRTGAVLLQE